MENSEKRQLCLGLYCLDGEFLGGGKFSRIELATHSLLTIKVAIKIFDVKSPAYRAEKFAKFTWEGHILSQLRHPYIVRLYEMFVQKDQCCILMEYISKRTLDDFLVAQGGKLEENKAKKIFKHLASAVSYLGNKGFCHCDINLKNVMINDDEIAKLIGFGMCKNINEGCHIDIAENKYGDLRFTAPELIDSKGLLFGIAADLWSLGILLYTVLVGEVPFPRHGGHEVYRGINKVNLLFNKRMSWKCKNLICDLLEPEPLNRTKIKDVLKHPWVTSGIGIPQQSKKISCCTLSVKVHDYAVHQVANLLRLGPLQVLNHVSRFNIDSVGAMLHLYEDALSNGKVHGSLSDLTFLGKKKGRCSLNILENLLQRNLKLLIREILQSKSPHDFSAEFHIIASCPEECCPPVFSYEPYTKYYSWNPWGTEEEVTKPETTSKQKCKKKNYSNRTRMRLFKERIPILAEEEFSQSSSSDDNSSVSYPPTSVDRVSLSLQHHITLAIDSPNSRKYFQSEPLSQKSLFTKLLSSSSINFENYGLNSYQEKTFIESRLSQKPARKLMLPMGRVHKKNAPLHPRLYNNKNEPLRPPRLLPTLPQFLAQAAAQTQPVFRARR